MDKNVHRLWDISKKVLFGKAQQTFVCSFHHFIAMIINCEMFQAGTGKLQPLHLSLSSSVSLNPPPTQPQTLWLNLHRNIWCVNYIWVRYDVSFHAEVAVNWWELGHAGIFSSTGCWTKWNQVFAKMRQKAPCQQILVDGGPKRFWFRSMED